MFSEKDDPGCLGNTVIISAHAAMQGTMLYTLTKFKMKPKNHGFQVRNLPFLLDPFSAIFRRYHFFFQLWEVPNVANLTFRIKHLIHSYPPKIPVGLAFLSEWAPMAGTVVFPFRQVKGVANNTDMTWTMKSWLVHDGILISQLIIIRVRLGSIVPYMLRFA